MHAFSAGWNGAEGSDLAGQPPALQRLANPSGLIAVEAPKRQIVPFSQRDARTPLRRAPCSTNAPATVEPAGGSFSALLRYQSGPLTAVHKILGVEQWFNLMQRVLSSIVDPSFEVVRHELAHAVRSSLAAVQTEMIT